MATGEQHVEGRRRPDAGGGPVGTPGFATADYRIAQDYLSTSSKGLFQLSVPRRDTFRGYATRAARLGASPVSLVNVDSDDGYRIEMNVDPDLICVQVLLMGNARFRQAGTRVDAQSAQLVLQEARATTRKDWHGPSELMSFRLSRRALERMAADSALFTATDPLDFGTMQVIDLETVPTLWNHILTIYHDLLSPNPVVTGVAADLAERLLLQLLLQSIPNSYNASRVPTPAGGAAPYYVGRVERFIRQNLREPIGMEDLVQAGGVSARSIHTGFRRFRGTTPMGYLRELRLTRARTLLGAAGADGARQVTEVALDCGYGNLSQFSRDYRGRFREPPSATLRRAQAEAGETS